MQTSAEGLVTFLPHSLPFLYQPAGGLTGAVVIQSSVPTAAAPVQLVQQESTPANETELSQVATEAVDAEPEISEAQLDSDKQLIYQHPLFPLLTCLFDKCEKATVVATGLVTSESFDEDILAFVREQEQSGKPFFVDNPEVDGLMVRAIQVLRIHILEIEKVGELCKDFCQRYITSLKTKLSSEHLLGEVGDCTTLTDDDILALQQSSLAVTDTTMQSPLGALAQGQVVSGGTVYQMVQTPQGLVAQPIQIQQPVITNTPSVAASSLLTTVNPVAVTQSQTSLSDDDDRKLKRGVLPKRATQIMKSWLFQHIAHPYPTEDEKRQIAAQTNLTLLQVNNWFINGRRRILQPMLDSAGAAAAEPKPKANKSSTKSAQRFWPENIAGLQVQPSALTVEDSDSHVSNDNVDDIELTCEEVEQEAASNDGDATRSVEQQPPSPTSPSADSPNIQPDPS